MLIKDFTMDMVSFDGAQFAIGIALSQLGESEASVAVIGFLALNGNDSKYGDDDMVRRQRKQVKAEVAAGSKGMVMCLLEYFGEPVLQIISVDGKVKRKVNVRLSNLLRSHSMQQVYEQTMHILMHVSEYELLLQYMDTAEYIRVFQGDLKKTYGVSADRVRRNDLNLQIMEEIRKEFREWVNLYGLPGYDIGSGTPIAYLRFSFSKFFPKETIYNILNRSGQGMDLGGDEDKEYSALDFMGFDSDTAGADLDFVDVANRINRASVLIFSHNNNPVAFYDIFSCYRDRVLEQRFNEVRMQLAKQLPGIRITILDSAQEEGRGHEGAITNKKNGRKQLCRDFETIVTDGISRDEIVRLYQKVISTTETLVKKDGVRLFSTPSHATKHVETNSEMMQIIVSGYLAMKELIDYLEMEDTVSSFCSFPYTIFRDREYLRRFQNIEEYINFINDVKPLVEEVASDNQRRLDVVDGLFSNDAVWGYLGARNLMSDSIFTKLSNVPLTYVKNAVDDSRAKAKEELFADAVKGCFDNVNAIYDPIGRNLGEDLAKADFATVLSLARMISNPQVFDEVTVQVKYSIAITYVLALKNYLAAIGKPVVSWDGNFSLKETQTQDVFKNILIQIGFSALEDPEHQKNLITAAGIGTFAFNKVYGFYAGCEVAECDWEQIREVFYVTDFLLMLSRLYHDRLNKLQRLANLKNSTYLLIISAAESLPVLSVADKIYTVDDLNVICGADIPKYYVGHAMSRKDSQLANKQRNQMLVTSVNRWFEALGEDRTCLGFASELLDKYVPKKFSKVTESSLSEKLLQKASEELRSFGAINSIARDLRYQLVGSLDFDQLGFAMNNGERIKIEDRYIHRSGFVIMLDEFNKTYTRSVLTNELLQSAMNQVAYRNSISGGR